jgi:hypothetical protein
MAALTTPLLGRACHIYLGIAYPDGDESIPSPRRFYYRISPEHSLEQILAPPLCQQIVGPEGEFRGYSLRLGSSVYPHLKLHIIDCDRQATWVFTVETHDAWRLDPDHPDAAGWARLQEANRLLKERIENAWEAEGLLTFNGLLRRGLDEH